jgi:hypothetical protein
MSQISDIRTSFETIATDIGVAFVFDDLSAINVQDNTYPLLLLKLPSKARNRDYRQHWKTYEIEFFMFDLENNSTSEEIAIKWDELEALAEDAISQIAANPNVYRIEDKNVEWDFGHFQHNDMLVGVKCSFGLKAFECFDMPPTGDLFFLIDDTHYLLIDDTHKLILQ